MMAGAFVVGSYFTLSEVLLPRIRALTETTVTIPDDVGFNRDVSGILAGFDDGGGATYVLSSEVKLATNSSWWTTDYTKKKQLSLRNLGAVPLATQSATTQEITVNTKELFDAGALQANCEDLRVVFVATASANMRVEVPRSYSLAPGATNCSDSTATTIAFPLQEALWANGGTDGNYELYYGNAGVGQASYPRTMATTGNGSTSFTAPDNDSLSSTSFTLSFWTKWSGSFGWQQIGKFNPSNPDGLNEFKLQLLNDGRWYMRFNNSATTALNTWGATFDPSTDKWHHFSVTYDADTDALRIVQDFDRVLLNATSSITINPTDFDFKVMSWGSDDLIDDIRLWNVALTDAELQARSGVNIDASDPLYANMTGYWRLDEGSGLVAKDYSSFGNNASLSSVTWTNGQVDAGYSVGAGLMTSATLVCPFNGSTTCVGGETPSTETGAIRYSGGSALQFNDPSKISVGNPASLVISDNITMEAWIKPTSYTGGYPRIIYKEGRNFDLVMYTYAGGEGRMEATYHRSDGSYCAASTPVTNIASLNQWTHVASTYQNGAIKIFVNGISAASNTCSAVGLDLTPSLQTFIGSAGSSQYFHGNVDEVRISDTIRYTSNFTPQTTPFEPDSHTKLLYHFDENGDDPRNTGKAFDSSGNGNHGTITGAKYVSGLVGVDNSSSTSGALPVQSTVGHSGIFIEEGTTNLITNPSFENATSYKTNWNPPVTFSLEDQYTTTRTAASLNGTAAEPSGQTRTVVNTNNKISVASGKLTFATGAAVYDGVWYPAQSRVAGKMLVATITPADTNGDVVFGWDSNQAGAINDAIKFTASGVLKVIPNGGTAITVGAYSATTYQVAAVMRTAGVFWYIKGGTYSNWTLLYASTAGTGDGYPAVQAGSTTAIFTADNIRIPTTTWLPTPLAYDSFSRADGALGTTETLNPDGKATPQITWSGDTWSVSGNKTVNVPNLGSDVIVNGSFESGNPPTSWTEVSSPTTFEQSSTQHQEGSYSLHVIGDSQNDGARQYANLTNNLWYVMSGYIYPETPAGAAYYTFGMGGTKGISSPTYTFGTQDTWLHLSIADVVSGSGSKDINLIPIYQPADIYFDDISVKPLTTSELFNTIDSGKSDVVVEADVTMASLGVNRTPAGLVLRLDNVSNPQNFLLAIINGGGANQWGYAQLIKYVNGTYTTLYSTQLYYAGTQYSAGKRLRAVMHGSTVELYYGDLFLTTVDVPDLGIVNNTRHGTFSTTPTSSLDNFQIWSTGSQGEYSDLPTGMTSSENTVMPYHKFGSKSVRLENVGAEDQAYTTTATASATAAYTLSAYVYNGTSGATGGTVDSSVASLASGSASLASTYTDMGGGWWRLSFTSGTQPAGTYVQGVEVKPGKTVYVDGVQLEQKTHASTYADGSLGNGYSWSGTENESISTRTIGDLRYTVTGNISNTQGAYSFWVKPRATSWDSLFDTSLSIGCGYLNLVHSGSMMYLYDSCSNQISRSVTWSNDEWKHIVVVWGENYLNLYLNSVGSTALSAFNQRTMSSIYLNRGGLSMISDFRIFDKALTPSEVSALYNQGLATHSSGSEAVDRYQASGTYTSPVIDLGANGAWGATPLGVTNTLGGGGINYFTRTSPDNSAWSSWEAVTGSVVDGSWTGGIASNPRRYFQWKADLTSSGDQSETPVISSLATTYVEDSTPPSNPATVALGYATAASSSATLTTGEWYNYATPKFTWDAGLDDAASGQSSSGIDGYHVLLTTDDIASPSAELADDCYAFVQSDAREFSVGSNPSGCALSDADYYLRVQTKDNSGNVSDPVTLFTYKYDGTGPRSPASVSSTTVGYTSQDGFTFYWPAASDQGANQSGIAYYEYKTGATEGAFSDWTKSNQRGEELVTIASDITAYQEGQNFFFVRTVDNAGNVSATTSNIGVSPFYYNASAPTAPQNVVITPETTSDTPAAENIFGVTWDKPASYSGELAKYYYCVNCTPSADTMTETTSGETADRELTTVALATQQGKNTFYLVAEDNNVNTATGHGNRNFEAYASADFYATTIAPGAPTNLTISDASDRDAEIWRLTLAWKQAATGGTPAHYTIYRSTEGGAYTNIGETTSTAYTDADLTQSQDYSYKVLAIDNAGSSSIASNIVTLAPEGKYTTPPLNSGSPGVTAGSTTAVITWSTGRLAYGAVEYGKTTSYESSVAETVGVTSHSIKLTGLTPGTEYHYRVQALDDSVLMGYDRENAYSSDYTFTTSATPTISDVTASDLTLSSVVVNWSAVSLASASIEYGESTAYGSTVAVGVGTSGTYSTKLTNLTDSTSYHFRIRATDIDGTDITSDDYSFTTLTFPKVTAVVFKTDQAQNGTAISLAWSTNVPTTSELEYQPVQVDPKYKATAESNYDNSSVLRSLTPAQLNQLPVVPVGEVEHSDRASYESRHLSRITSLTDGSLYIFTIRGRRSGKQSRNRHFV